MRSSLADRAHVDLEAASHLLGDAAGALRDLDLNSEVNIRRIAEALSIISEVASELYDREPQLIPLYLRDTKRFKHHFA